MVSEVANVSTEGQVTIPAEFREALGLGEGDPVVFERHDGCVIIRRATVVEQTYGALAKYGKAPPPTIEELKEAAAHAIAEGNASYK